MRNAPNSPASAPAKAKKPTWAIVIFGILVVLSIIGLLIPNRPDNPPVNAQITPPPVAAPATAEAAAPAAPAPSTSFSLNALPGWPAGAPQKVEADQMYKDYVANEVSADMKYKGKLLMTNAVMESISKNIMDETYLALKVSQSIFGINATLNTTYIPEAAKLSKGQTVTVVCVGAGKLIGPQMENCAIAAVDGNPVTLGQ